MLYTEYIHKVKEATISQLDNGIWYLEPEWRIIAHENELFIDDISDFEVTMDEVLETLRLEVDRRNALNDNTKAVMDWLYDLITATVEPAMLQEETDYIKQVVEFMKENHSTNKETPDNIVPFPTK